MTPAFADASPAARPLYVVAPDDLAQFLASQPGPVQAWLAAQGFDAALGDLRLIPGDTGVAAAVIGHGTPQTRARQRFALAKACLLYTSRCV